MLVAGIDISTQATKVLVVDPDDGRVVAAGRAPHEVTGAGGARETDPEGWWQALRLALTDSGVGEAPEALARRWNTRRGVAVEPPAERDRETLERIRATRDATLALHERG